MEKLNQSNDRWHKFLLEEEVGDNKIMETVGQLMSNRGDFNNLDEDLEILGKWRAHEKKIIVLSQALVIVIKAIHKWKNIREHFLRSLLKVKNFNTTLGLPMDRLDSEGHKM